MNVRPSLLALAALLAASGTAFAADPLSVFQPSHIRAISVTPADAHAIHAFPPLDTFGTVFGTVSPGVDRVGSASEASQEAGFPLRLPTGVPADLASRVGFAVTGRVHTTFTFRRAKAAAWARAHGVSQAPVPAGLDGARYTAVLRPVAIVTYGTQPQPRRGEGRRGSRERGVRLGNFLAVVQGPVPTVTSHGASLQTLEGWFAAQPGIPPHLAAEIRAIGDPTQTLPIPVRFDRQSATPVRVDGVAGLAIGDETGIGSVVVWTKNGRLYAVGGTLPQSRILALADTLR